MDNYSLILLYIYLILSVTYLIMHTVLREVVILPLQLLILKTEPPPPHLTNQKFVEDDPVLKYQLTKDHRPDKYHGEFL